MAFHFEAYKNDVERKAEAVRRDITTWLFREDGTTCRYGPKDHQEILEHILTPLKQAVAGDCGARRGGAGIIYPSCMLV